MDEHECFQGLCDGRTREVQALQCGLVEEVAAAGGGGAEVDFEKDARAGGGGMIGYMGNEGLPSRWVRVVTVVQLPLPWMPVMVVGGELRRA